MPIKPKNKGKYPENWAEISLYIRTVKSAGYCEFCGVPNHVTINKWTRKRVPEASPDSFKVVLTAAHMDHNPENCDIDNLKALCQRCHLNYDKNEHLQSRKLANTLNQTSLDF